MLTPSVGRGSVGEQLAVAIFCLGLILGGVVSAVMAWILGGLFSPIPMPLAAALVASLVSGSLNAIRRQGLAVCVAAAAW